MATEKQEQQFVRRKGGKGRRKIEIKKVSQFSNRQVTFSKRKANLFKKAKQLAMDCKARIAVFALSEKGRPHDFGNPNADTLISQFLATTNNDGITPPSVPITIGDQVNHMDDDLQKSIESLLEMRAKVVTQIDKITMSMNDDHGGDLIGEAEGILGNTDITTDCQQWNYLQPFRDEGSYVMDQQWSYLPPFRDEGSFGCFDQQWTYLSPLRDEGSYAVDEQWTYLPPFDEDINFGMVSTADDEQWTSYLEKCGYDNAVEGLRGNVNVPRVDNQWSYLAADWTNGYASVSQP